MADSKSDGQGNFQPSQGQPTVADKLKAWAILKFLKGQLPLWVYRPAGKRIAKKLEELMENQPEQTTSVPKWKSRTFWISIITALIAAVKPVSESLGHPVEVPQYVIEVLIGMGLYTARFPKS